MGQGPLPTYSQYPGGNTPAYYITAAGTVKATKGIIYRAVINAPGSGSGAFTLNDTNVYVAAQTITAITAATNAVVTISTSSSANPFAVGNPIAFTGVGGMTQLLPLVGTVTAIGGVTTAWTITTNINSTNFTAYTSGGTCASFSAANQLWSLAYNATANVGGGVFVLDWPCQSGITVSAVPGAGSPILALSYF
jgi:hypothetical protein